MRHPLHEVIGDLLATSIAPGCVLVKDPACRGDQRIPLFCSDAKSLPNTFCNVDLLILSHQKIRIIVEIEQQMFPVIDPIAAHPTVIDVIEIIPGRFYREGDVHDFKVTFTRRGVDFDRSGYR